MSVNRERAIYAVANIHLSFNVDCRSKIKKSPSQVGVKHQKKVIIKR